MSNKFLKFALIGVCAFALNAFAEKEGAFMGVELGANKVKFKQDIDINMGQIANGSIKADNYLPSIALKGGYKWFFTQNLGVRAYGQIGVGYGSMKNIKYSGALQQFTQGDKNIESSIFTGTRHTYYTTFIDYFVGADLLYNFVSNQDLSFGVYGGLGLGAVTWIANGKEFEVSNGERTYLDFSANANVGVRTVIKEKHGVELGARFTFPKSKLFEANNGQSKLLPSAPIKHTKTTHARSFSILLAYTYNF